MTEKVSSKDISAAALQVFSREELQQMPEQVGLNLMHLIAKRLKQPGPPPTQDELEGIKELVTEHLWHSALTAITKGRE
jgi:hypothetical protein